MSHINKKGNPYIIDISNKDVTERVAVASGEIKFDKETYKKIKSFETKKGNLEKTAIIGGIMGAKETSRLIPLCHNIPINHINIEVIKNDKKFTFIVKSTVKTNANTGVEMEALTAVTISCLTIYDMCKYLNKKIKIQNVHLVSKIGVKKAIIVQNVLWIVLHIYELEILSDSMTWFGSLLLAITLGILGDMIALKWNSVRPLMLGHIWLNVGWVVTLFIL